MADITKRIPEDFINALLSRLDIVEVIGAFVPLRKSGVNYVACCPFHSEKTPSFSVNQTKQFYHCFGCGVSGDAIQFVIEHNSLSFVEAVELLAAQIGMQLPTLDQDQEFIKHKLIYNVLSEATMFFEQQLRQQKLAQHAVQYLKVRGLTGVTAKSFRLGFAPPGWDNLLNSFANNPTYKEYGLQAGLFIQRDDKKYYDRFRNRIMFPIRNRSGKIIGFGARAIGDVSGEPKYLNSPETSVFSKSHELYGYYEAKQSIRQSQTVLVVEGYMDVVSLTQQGISNVVATLGTACTTHHVQYLFKIATDIIFCFDGDIAGRKAAWRALELCLPLLDDKHRIKFLILRDNEDPDSFVRKHGAPALQMQIKQAASLPDFLFETLVKSVDLEQIDGRVQFANQVKEYLLKIADSMLKTMLFDRLAKMIEVDPSVLYNKGIVVPARNQQTEVVLIKNNSLSPAIRALSLLISYRELLADLPNIQHLESLDIPGSALFCRVSQILQDMPSATDVEIQAQLPVEMTKNFNPIELRGFAQIVPAVAVKQEFLGMINLMRRREKELVLEGLLKKAKKNELSPEEKVLLQQILREKG